MPPLTEKQRAALTAAVNGLYRDRHGWREGYRSGAPRHAFAVVRPLLNRRLIGRPAFMGGMSFITEAGRAMLAASEPPPTVAAPIRQYRN